MEKNNNDKIIEISKKVLDLKDKDAIEVLENAVDVIWKYERLAFNDLPHFAKLK